MIIRLPANIFKDVEEYDLFYFNDGTWHHCKIDYQINFEDSPIHSSKIVLQYINKKFRLWNSPEIEVLKGFGLRK